MAFPSSTSPTTTVFASSVTSMAVNLPASISSGDLLIAHVGVRNAGTWTPPSGWTVLVEQGGGGAVGETGVWYKIATGSEGGSATWTAGVATTAAWQVRKITSWHGTTAPEYASNNGDAVAVNPPSLTPSWGAADTLWLALVGSSANTMNFTGAPANFTDLTSTTASSGGGASNAGSAIRQNNAASEDPGTFTVSQNRWWASVTVGVRPAASGPSPVTLVVNDVSSSAPLDTTVLTQKHTVSISDVGSSAALDTVTLTQKYTLGTQDVASTALLDGVTLTQKHTLSINELSSGNQVEAVSLTQKNTLVVADLSTGASVEGVVLTQKSTLSVAEVGSEALLDGATVTVSYELGVNGLASTSLLGSVALSQSYTLELDNIGSDSTIEATSLASGYVLTVNDISSATAIDSVAPTQKHTLTVADVVSQAFLEGTLLSQRVTLSVNDLSSTTSLGSVGLTHKTLLSVSDVHSTSAMGAVDLAQKNTLSVNKAHSIVILYQATLQTEAPRAVIYIEVQEQTIERTATSELFEMLSDDNMMAFDAQEMPFEMAIEDSLILMEAGAV